MIIGYTVSEIWCMMDVIVIFHFGLFFTLLPLTDRKKKIQENEKKACRYHHSTQLYQKS